MYTRRPGLRRNALSTAAMAVVLGACSSPAPESWRVAPIYHVAHAGGANADSGYKALARQYEGEHRWREARDAWRKAALAAPQDADTLNALGMAEAGQGLYGNAVEALRRAVALAPQSAQLLNNLGYALLLDGRNAEAKIVLKEALVRKPEHLLAKANLDRIDQLADTTNPPVTPPKDTAAEPQMATLNTAHPGSLVAPAPLSPREPAIRAQDVQTTPNLAPLSQRQAGLAEAQTATPTPAPAAPAQSAPPPSVPTVPPRIEIANGNGVTGMASALRTWLRAHGLSQHPILRNALPFSTATTVVHYRVGYLAIAQELAGRMPQPVELAPTPGEVRDVDVRLVLGHDQRGKLLPFL